MLIRCGVRQVPTSRWRRHSRGGIVVCIGGARSKVCVWSDPAEVTAISQPEPQPERSADRPVSKGPPRLTPLREMQLLEAHRAGDPAALSELMSSYQRRVYSICYRMVRHEEEARDLTQDTLLKVIDALDSYDGRAALSTWIIRITINCCLSHLRKRKVRRQTSLDRMQGGSEGDSGPPGRIPSALATTGEHSGARRVEREETRQTIARALDHLDPDSRAVLLLRDVQDLEYQQISEVLDLAIGTVKSRLFRARAALREQMERLLDEEQRPARKTGTTDAT